MRRVGVMVDSAAIMNLRFVKMCDDQKAAAPANRHRGSCGLPSPTDPSTSSSQRGRRVPSQQRQPGGDRRGYLPRIITRRQHLDGAVIAVGAAEEILVIDVQRIRAWKEKERPRQISVGAFQGAVQ